MDWLEADRQALIKAGFVVTDYSITNKNKYDIEAELTSHDVIFFSGGNDFYLLQQIQLSDCADIIAPHWNSKSFKNRYLNERFENLYNCNNKIILLNDNQYIDYEDGLYRIIDISDTVPLNYAADIPD